MLSVVKKVHLFNGLNEKELEDIASSCEKLEIPTGTILVTQNTTGDEVYFIGRGVIEVFVEGLEDERLLVMLGEGQVFGEMALIGHGYRSASGRAGKEGCTVYRLKAPAFNNLCEQNKNIGYVVMRNLALDLAFKLRHRNLTGV